MPLYNETLVNVLPSSAFPVTNDDGTSCPVPMVDPSLADDDSSIVSSLSTSEDQEENIPPAPRNNITSHPIRSSSSSCTNKCLPHPQQERPRSIFQSYWKETATAPARRRPCKAIPCPPSPRGVADQFLRVASEQVETPSNKVDYEQILKQMELPSPINDRSSFYSTSQKRSASSGVSLLVSPYASRPLAVTGRNWGGWWQASLPSLDAFNLAGGRATMSSRKAKSESNLNSRPKTLASCLRDSRYTPPLQSGRGDAPPQPLQQGSSSPSPRRRTPSVSFQQVVEVVRFEAPMESWAAEGWSSWFDYQGD
jgi:hypothetical protein